MIIHIRWFEFPAFLIISMWEFLFYLIPYDTTALPQDYYSRNSHNFAAPIDLMHRIVVWFTVYPHIWIFIQGMEIHKLIIHTILFKMIQINISWSNISSNILLNKRHRIFHLSRTHDKPSSYCRLSACNNISNKTILRPVYAGITGTLSVISRIKKTIIASCTGLYLWLQYSYPSS